jgi:type VI secretion system protein ImpG
MLDDLLPFYERELSAVRALAAEFSERHPKVARRLQINPGHCDDPQVERLLQSFAWFGARIHRRLDDEIPEIAEPLIQALGPHFLRPIPSAAILQVRLKPGQATLPGKYTLPRHCQALSPAVHGSRCAYRTCHELDLWPLDVARAGLELEAQGDGQGTSAITLDLVHASGTARPDLEVDRLRFHLDGEAGLVNLLSELLGSRLRGVRVIPGGPEGAGTLLPASRVTRAGFSDQESLFDPDPDLLPGYRLLFEYFVFPEKFRFFELAGLGRVPPEGLRLRFLLPRLSGAGREVRLLETLSADTFKLGCVPAVNLFPQAAESIRLSGRQASYPLVLKGRGGSECEIYSVDSVRLTRPGATAASAVAVPAAAPGHGPWAGEPGFAWRAVREGSPNRADPGAERILSLVDSELLPFQPPAGTLDAQLTCTNRNLAEAIPFGSGDPGREGFVLASHPVVGQVRALRKPTPGWAPPAKPGLLWRIIAHLAMNHLSLAALDREGLQAILELYAFGGSTALTRESRGLHRLETRPVTALVAEDGQPRFARGIEVAVTFDEDGLGDADPFLFAAILERFLAQACLRNSFLQLRLHSRQRQGELAGWPLLGGGAALV